MYAIIKTGGKQYRVKTGDILRVEKLDKALGDEVEISDVLFVSGDKTFIGEPMLQNAKVTAVVTNHAKAPKIIVLKRKRRQGYRRFHGHRQIYTELFVKSIESPEGQKVESDVKAPVFDPIKREERLKKAADEKAAAKTEGTDNTTKKATAKKAATKKKVTKKKVAKKKVAKKAAKKKVAKKKVAKKTATKKAAKKKTAKKS